MSETDGQIDLAAVARELHEIAVRRGKYRDWSLETGVVRLVLSEAEERVRELIGGDDDE